MFDEVPKKKFKNATPEAPNFSKDYSANLDYYKKMIAKIEFGSEAKETVQIDNGEWINALFPFKGQIITYKGHSYKSNWAFNISFHQEHRSFRKELCLILNSLGEKGMLRRIDKPKPPVDPDDKWGQLFN